jgi:hypothetical protein
MATYSEVSKIVAAIFGADEKARRGALTARLQNLQKFGIPLGMNVGRGKRIDYRNEQIFQLAFCLELEDIGIMPSQIERIIKGQWRGMIHGYFKTALKNIDAEDDMILIFELSQMTSTWSRDLESQDYYFAAVRANNETLGATIKKFLHEGWRHLALVNVSNLVRAVEKQRALVPDALVEGRKA